MHDGYSANRVHNSAFKSITRTTPSAQGCKMESENKLSTRQKALSINLDESRYGTIVEIGAGQEVAGQFFRAGAAAGTVAKTMSAYDMQFSDQIYGKAGRYVSSERVEQMLEHEYGLLQSRLKKARGDTTTFFTYAATVSAKSYSSNNFCHGYIGIRFQRSPGEPHSDIIMHAHMLDDDNDSQAKALGVLGVNVVYGAYNFANDPQQFIHTLLDNISANRIEIDFIEFRGEAFKKIENRLMNLQLIRSWCARAVLFDADGNSQVPVNLLRKNPIMVIRGSFRPPTKVHSDMFKVGVEAFANLRNVEQKNIVSLAEITMSELGQQSESSDSDFLARVDLLNSLGHSVLISDYYRFFRLRSWLRKYTHEPLAITLSVLDINQLFDPAFYAGLEGGILEAMGKLFPDNTHVFVYPSEINGELTTLNNVRVEPSQKFLLKYLIDNKLLLDCPALNHENLHISARTTYEMIASGQTGWEDNVDPRVASSIHRNDLFSVKP